MKSVKVINLVSNKIKYSRIIYLLKCLKRNYSIWTSREEQQEYIIDFGRRFESKFDVIIGSTCANFRSDVRSIDGRYNSYLSVLASCSPNGMIRDSLPFRKSTMDNLAISTNPTIDRHVIQITAVDAGHRYFITYRFARSRYKPTLFHLYKFLCLRIYALISQSRKLTRNEATT